jgi:hypothetical protein
MNPGGTKRRLPLFAEDEADPPKAAKKVKLSKTFVQSSDEDRSPSPADGVRSPSPEVQVVESSSGKRRKGKGASAVAELDMVLQGILKHGYSEEAFLLNGLVYVGVCLVPCSPLSLRSDSPFERR